MLRTVARASCLAGTIAQAMAEHAWESLTHGMPLAKRAAWLHRWCAICLRRLGVQYVHEGVAPRNTLLVANHLSYLDVLVFSAVAPCVFVAKKEVERWPVFGKMARLAGTIFVDRGRRADVHRVAEQISEAALAGVAVVVFPEGGSSNGRSVLPFYSSLLEPAIELQLPVTPAHISYTLRDGDPETDVCYWGDMTLAPHLVRLLSKHEVRPRVRFGHPVVYSDRKQAATETRTEVLRLATP